MSRKGKAVVLLSGGLDSTTLLYHVREKGYAAHCLIFDYGQRHRKEIEAAKRIARTSESKYETVKITLPWKGSSLLDRKKKLPRTKAVGKNVIPSTYVPARNIIFLSFAASCAETVKAEAVFIGANAIDYSGYPDCRPGFLQAFQRALKKGQKRGVQGQGVKIHSPLVTKSKAQIIRMGMKLNVPYGRTWSCYSGGRLACGVCDSCRLRLKGFEEAGYEDPLRYANR